MFEGFCEATRSYQFILVIQQIKDGKWIWHKMHLIKKINFRKLLFLERVQVFDKVFAKSNSLEFLSWLEKLQALMTF